MYRRVRATRAVGQPAEVGGSETEQVHMAAWGQLCGRNTGRVKVDLPGLTGPPREEAPQGQQLGMPSQILVRELW